jgi:hypothetical protein
MENVGIIQTDLEWIDFQLEYIENVHEYYTETAKNIRQTGKMVRIQELKNERADLIQSLENN